jgi:hypothetical protein
VDNLDNQINEDKNKILQSVVVTEREIDTLLDKVDQQVHLNRKLKQLREGVLLMMFAFLFVLYIIRYLGHGRLRALVHENSNK